jgi:hypothetical protein
MGTAVAPDAANVFIAVCEDVCGVYTASALSTVLPPGAEILFFARLIDDYTIIVSGDANLLHPPTSPLKVQAVEAVTTELEARAGPHLRISWTASRRSMDTLDLHVYKRPDFIRTRRFSYRTHQKLGNRYSYLPFSTRDAPGVSKSVVKSEVIRHAINCSSFDDFRHMVEL